MRKQNILKNFSVDNLNAIISCSDSKGNIKFRKSDSKSDVCDVYIDDKKVENTKVMYIVLPDDYTDSTDVKDRILLRFEVDINKNNNVKGVYFDFILNDDFTSDDIIEIIKKSEDVLKESPDGIFSIEDLNSKINQKNMKQEDVQSLLYSIYVCKEPVHTILENATGRSIEDLKASNEVAYYEPNQVIYKKVGNVNEYRYINTTSLQQFVVSGANDDDGGSQLLRIESCTTAQFYKEKLDMLNNINTYGKKYIKEMIGNIPFIS